MSWFTISTRLLAFLFKGSASWTASQVPPAFHALFVALTGQIPTRPDQAVQRDVSRECRRSLPVGTLPGQWLHWRWL